MFPSFPFQCCLQCYEMVINFKQLYSKRRRGTCNELNFLVRDKLHNSEFYINWKVVDHPVREGGGHANYFKNLVYDSFTEVESKTILFRHCLNCTEGIIFLSPYAGRSISDIVPERKILDKVSVCGVVFYGSWVYEEMTALYECLEFLDC